MKVGICIGFGRETDLQKKFSDAAAEGFQSCQFIAWEPTLWTKENAEQIKALSQETGVEISAFWCGWVGPAVWNFYEGPKTLGLLPEEYRAERIQNLCDGSDFARMLGVRDIVTHMGFIPEDPNDPKFAALCDAIRTVAEHVKANGQRLLFETGQETPTAMLRCFETVNTGNLGVNLDTANLILYGKANPIDALDTIGSYVYNVHAKDGCYPTDGKELGREVRLGDGKVDFPRLIARLKELHYDGPLTIEREISGEQQIKDIRYAKQYLESLL